MNDSFYGKRKSADDDGHIDHPRKYLRIDIPGTIPTDSYSPSSLFSTLSSALSAVSQFQNKPLVNTTTMKPALLTAPPIPGLYFIPTLELPQDLADGVLEFCMSTYFHHPSINQIMLFTRFSPSKPSSNTQFPPILTTLLTTLSTLLRPHLPADTHSLLFPDSPTCARQVILNLYAPGEGITPHVDLLKRFGDGIVGVSLGSSCVMQFAQVDNGPPNTEDEASAHSPARKGGNEPEQDQNQKGIRECYDLYLPERSILVLSSDVRYKWSHGIEGRKADFVSHPSTMNPLCDDAVDAPPEVVHDIIKGRWIDRGIRLSLTFRWLLPGADVVGNAEGLSPGFSSDD